MLIVKAQEAVQLLSLMFCPGTPYPTKFYFLSQSHVSHSVNMFSMVTVPENPL